MSKRKIITPLLVLYSAVVVMITLGKSLFVVGSLWSPDQHHLRTLKLIPLETFFFANPWWGGWTNFIGNVALFIPIGMLLGMRYIRYVHGVRKAAIVGGLMSLTIEVIQFVFALGFSDINDLLFNTTGTALGAWLVHSGHLRMRHAVASTVAAIALACGVFYYWARIV